MLSDDLAPYYRIHSVWVVYLYLDNAIRGLYNST